MGSLSTQGVRCGEGMMFGFKEMDLKLLAITIMFIAMFATVAFGE